LKAKKLLSKLDSIEEILSDYSYEELNANDSAQLKKSFESFKGCLENMVFQKTPSNINYNTGDSDNQDVERSNSDKVQPTNNTTMLIANVSHEIRTPLNGIIGFTDLLKEEKLSETQLEKVKAIKAASNSLLKIINQLLEYSKLTEGLEQIENSDFNFHNVIDNVLYLCNTLITSDKVVLKSSVDPGIPQVLKGNPAKLSQVLLNLIGNAVKFVEEGRISLDIALKSQRNRNVLLEFTVSDTGIGISKDNLGHIFDSFKQAEKDTNEKYGGTGLGLSIVKKIIELSNGTIQVKSELGKGTEFKFTMPYSKGDAKNLPDEDAFVLDLMNSRPLIENKRILVFEDNTMNQTLFKQRLKFWGCKSYVTDDGLAGLQFLQDHEVDLILTDLRMPGMTGFEITQEIRKNVDPRISNIPIIAVSADISAKEMKNCETVGIDDFILKPFSSEELMMKIVRNLTDENWSERNLNPKKMIAKPTPKFNLKNMMDECEGEISFLKELVSLFKGNVIEFIGTSKISLKNGDFQSLDFACHKMKSGLNMLSASSMLEIVEKMQVLCKTDKNENEINSLYQSFIQEYMVVEQLIDIEMERILTERKN